MNRHIQTHQISKKNDTYDFDTIWSLSGPCYHHFFRKTPTSDDSSPGIRWTGDMGLPWPHKSQWNHHLSQARSIPGRSKWCGKYMEPSPRPGPWLVLDRVTHHGVDLNGSEVPLSSQLAHQHGRHRRGQDVVKDLVLNFTVPKGQVGAPGPKIPTGWYENIVRWC